MFSLLKKKDHKSLNHYSSFNYLFYIKNNPDIAASNSDPLMHYLLHGWIEGRNPNEFDKTIIAQMALKISYRERSGGKLILNFLENDAVRQCRPTGYQWRHEALRFDGLHPSTTDQLKRSLDVINNDVDPQTYEEYDHRTDNYLDIIARFGSSALEKLFSSENYRIADNIVKNTRIPSNIQIGRDRSHSGSLQLANIPHQTKEAYQNAIADIKSRLSKNNLNVKQLNAPVRHPQISIVTPVYNVDPKWLDQLIKSILRQTCGDWELILVDDCSTSQELKDRLYHINELDKRIIVYWRKENGGISKATNDGINLATSEYVAFVDNDDMLTTDAIEIVLKTISDHNSPDIIYSDEFKIDEENEPYDLFCKPDWSPLLLQNYMYIGHLTVCKKKLINEVGGLRSEFDFSQDYDLILRMTEIAQSIVHVPRYIYGWRSISSSSSAGGKPYARLSNILALQDAANRRKWNASVIALPWANKVSTHIPGASQSVSIVVPSDNIENIRASISSIIMSTSYTNYEIIVVTRSLIRKHISMTFKHEKVKFVDYDKPFNFSEKCNTGARFSKADFLVFYNDDVRPLEGEWLENLIAPFAMGKIGATGPKLLYENGLIQHAGMVTGVRGIVGTAFHSLPNMTNQHFNFAQCIREVSLLCGALLAMPRKVFEACGEYDTEKTPIKHSDVDLCFKVTRAGYKLVYTPHSKLLHIGHMSLKDDSENDFNIAQSGKMDKTDIHLLKNFGDLLYHDPYYTDNMRAICYFDSPEYFKIYANSQSMKAEVKGDVLLVSHDLTASGAPRVLYDIAMILSENGYYVVIASPSDGPMRKRYIERNIPVIIDNLLTTHPDWISKFARNFDLVICNTIQTWKFFSEIADYPNAYWYLHEGLYMHDVISCHSEIKQIISKSDNIIAVSQHTGKILEDYSASYVLLETGRDFVPSEDDRSDLKSQISPSPAKNVIKFAIFGSYESRKGQDIAADAMRYIDPNNDFEVELHAYGRSHDKIFKRELVQIYDGDKRIVFHDAVDQKSYEKLIAQYDVIVVTSRDDPLPLVCLDALALAKPIIMSATTGTSLYLQHRVSAMISEANTGPDIARIMIELAADAVLRKNIGEGGRRVQQEIFSDRAFKGRLSLILGVDLTENIEKNL